MTLNKTYIDEEGYLRFNDSDALVHRWVAHKHIYKKNLFKYPRKFSHYIIHHIDGNKLNNDPDNLEIMLQSEHEEIHGIDSTGLGPLSEAGESTDSSLLSKIIKWGLIIFVILLILGIVI